MQVRVGMSDVFDREPGTLAPRRRASMADRSVGAAVVIDLEQPGPGIITEQDILQSVGGGQDPDQELVATTTSPRRSPSRLRTGRSGVRRIPWSAAASGTSWWWTAGA